MDGEDRDHTPYVYRSKEHSALRNSVAAANDPVLIFGNQPGTGVTRVLQEFRKEISGMAPTNRLMASTVPLDFARLAPTGAALRAMVSLRNDIVKVADAVRVSHNSTGIPKLADGKFRQFDTLFELCWLGAIKREEEGNKPNFRISSARKNRSTIARYAFKLASGGLADIVLESEDLLSIFQSVLNDVTTDGVVEITEQAFKKATDEYKKRARQKQWYFDKRHRVVFEAAFPADGEPDLDGMLDLLTLLFNDGFSELVEACRSTSDVFIILDAVDEFNGETRAEVRIRETFSSLLTDPAIDACGVALGSRKKPHRWIGELAEYANDLDPIRLQDLTKLKVTQAWDKKSVDPKRASEALGKAFPGSKTRVPASKIAAAWAEAGMKTGKSK